ncbi:type IV secretion system protein [Lysobacter solisilvae (ex Woo and Kim 2020)]|uniref:Type IV secretion system protein n=1 Tax=Agrilutibacter terrestris TaxID=2865112 RepID=A0A7H0FXV6_9GAMM|nr:type IV secretion system protein [Lysobacter terrestris]QNP40872.1 type IV secretion system protein [Lysobacter terrestris]
MQAVAGAVADLFHFQVADLPNLVFFSEVNDFLDDEIAEFAGNLLQRVARFVGGIALTVVTWWIIYQGYRIVTGQSREPMMALVANSLRAVLIVGIAVGAAAGAGSVYRSTTDGLNTVVRKVVTGDEGEGSYADIDKTLAIMQVALQVIDSVDSGDDVLTDDKKNRALWLAGVGLGGPAIMAATTLLLNKIAMALVIGLGPIFILCLLFDQTKQLFSRWLYYGIGTLFSMAFLTVMVTLAMDMVIAIGMAFWAASWLSGGSSESLTSMAMQQGGLGIVLSMLIISAPPMAAMFFQGMLGQFSGYNAFQGQASPPGTSIPPVSQTQSPPARTDVTDVGSRGDARLSHSANLTQEQKDQVRVGPRQ